MTAGTLPNRSGPGRRWVVAGICLAVAAAVLCGGALLWVRRLIARQQPQTDGTLPVSGIEQSVTIVRDTFGVPHIFADNERDLFFGFGFAVAQDRLWQMDVLRRLGQGRLAEILGEDLVAVDRHFRMLAAGPPAAASAVEPAFVFEAYSDGINAFLTANADRLPLEFDLLGYRPEPWSATDTLAVFRVLWWGLSLGWKIDLTAADVLEKVGRDKFAAAFPTGGETGADSRPPLPQTAATGARLASVVRRVAALTGISPAAASNNWVVAGSRTVSGRPLLANDTHLALTQPSLWWEVHLACPTLEASGFAIAGLPAVSVGRNRRVAWGITNVMADDVDFFIERIHPSDPRRYRHNDQWLQMGVERQEIAIRGGGRRTVEIRRTRHGPLVEETVSAGRFAHAARWAAHDFPPPAAALYRLMKAHSAAAVDAALQRYDGPGQNFVFADAAGDIGYRCAAAIPIRAEGTGLLPVPGWTDRYDWQGYLPFDRRPHRFNPANGIFASANNPVSAGSAGPVIGAYWEPPDRIRRIEQRLSAEERLSTADMQSLQMDITCPLAERLVPDLLRVLGRRFSGERAESAGAALSKWNYAMDAGSTAACLFEVTFNRLLHNVFCDELGAELCDRYLATTVFPPRALEALLAGGQSPWFDNVATANRESKDDIIEQSLRQALAELETALGGNAADWRWGRLHTLTYTHVLGRRRFLDRVFNLGPYPVSGSHLTVDKKQYRYNEPYRVTDGVAQRMVVDFADSAGGWHVLPTGESGILGNPHRRDQVALYLDGRYHRAWLYRGDIERHSRSTLVLMPAR